MTVRELRLKVMGKIQHLEDMGKLEAIAQILNQEQETPYILSEAQIAGVEEGMQDYAKGEFLSQEIMLKEDEEREWMQQ